MSIDGISLFVKLTTCPFCTLVGVFVVVLVGVSVGALVGVLVCVTVGVIVGASDSVLFTGGIYTHYSIHCQGASTVRPSGKK